MMICQVKKGFKSHETNDGRTKNGAGVGNTYDNLCILCNIFERGGCIMAKSISNLQPEMEEWFEQYALKKRKTQKAGEKPYTMQDAIRDAVTAFRKQLAEKGGH